MASREETYRSTSRTDCLYIPPEELTVVRDPKHELFDPIVNEPLDEAFIANIMTCGVQSPINIRLNGKNKKGDSIIEVVNGRRRVLHALEANKRLAKAGEQTISVPCVVGRGSDETFAVQTMIVTNEYAKQRSPLDKAQKIKRLIDRGKSTKECAIVQGCSESTIYNYIKLLECDTAVQEAVAQGRIGADVARRLAPMTREEQKKTLAEMLANGLTKGRKAVSAAENAARGRAARPNRDALLRMRPRRDLERLKEKVATERDPAADVDIEIDVLLAAVAWTLGDNEAFKAKKLHALDKLVRAIDEPQNKEAKKRVRRKTPEVVG